jgi:methyl-accepting chemotaxis protein WspA
VRPRGESIRTNSTRWARSDVTSIHTQSIREQTIRIREAVEILNTLASSIVSASSQQEEAMLGFEGNVAQVGASAQQISATSQDLAKTMDGVKNAAREASSLANAGQTSRAA